MKRRTLKLAACAAIMAFTLSLTACGGDDAAKTTDLTETADVADETEVEAPADEADDVEAEVETDTETDDADAASDGEYTTLEDYYNDPTVQSVLDSAFDAMASEGMSVALEVEGNVFTVIIKIEDSTMIVDGLAEALDAALDEQADTFKEQVKQFDEVVEQEGACTVVMRYTDPDDNVLAEKSFKAD